MDDVLTMVAWCDPRCREEPAHSWSDVWVGALEVRRDRLTFRVNDQDRVTADLASAELTVHRRHRFRAPRFDLHTTGGSYAFYLSPPGEDAPSPTPDLAPSQWEAAGHGFGQPGSRAARLVEGNRNEKRLRVLLDGAPAPSAATTPVHIRPPELLYTRGDADTSGKVALFGSDGSVVACAHDDGTVRFHSTAHGTPLRTLKVPDDDEFVFIHSAGLSADGRKLLIGHESDTVELLDVGTGAVLASLVHEDEVHSASMDSGANWAVTISDGLHTRVWDLRTRKVIRELPSPDTCVAFSPATGRFAVIGLGGLFSYAGVDDPAPAHDETLASGAMRLVTVSQDELIATAGWDGSVYVYAPPLTPRLTHFVHDSPVTALAFSPAGDLLLTGDRDERLIAWDTHTGQKVFEVPTRCWVEGIAWSPRGDHIATASLFGLRVWRVPAVADAVGPSHPAP